MTLPNQAKPVMRNFGLLGFSKDNMGILPSGCMSCLAPVANAITQCYENGVTSTSCLQGIAGLCTPGCCDCVDNISTTAGHGVVITVVKALSIF